MCDRATVRYFSDNVPTVRVILPYVIRTLTLLCDENKLGLSVNYSQPKFSTECVIDSRKLKQ